MNNHQCRICLQSDEQKYISPCVCKGSIEYVHFSCLKKYIDYKFHTNCSICKVKYNNNYLFSEIEEVDDLLFFRYYPVVPGTIIILTSIYLMVINYISTRIFNPT